MDPREHALGVGSRPDAGSPAMLGRVTSLLLACAAVATTGCGRTGSEQAATDLAVRALGDGASSVDLEFRRKIDGGFVWRYAPRPLGSSADLPRPTHLGVIACPGDGGAGEAVRFSFLHWEPEGCDDGRARLRRVRRTPAQDARGLNTFISPPRGVEDEPELKRVAED